MKGCDSEVRAGGVSLCGVLSGWWQVCCRVGGVEGAVSDHGVVCEDAPVGEEDDGLVVAFTLGDPSVVVGP